MRKSMILLGLGLTACPPKTITEVTLDGRVFDGPDSIDGVPGATVELRTVDGALFQTVTADDEGRFSIQSPTGQPIFMVTNGFDHVPTSFTFNVGSVDMAVPSGVVWARRAPILDTIQEEFSGCNTAGSARTTIEGDVRIYLGPVNEDEELPIVTTALVYIDNQDGTLDAACYLDDAGQSDPEANVTGATGRYALFDANDGPQVLTVTYDADGATITNELLIYVPDGGTVPLYPTLVSLF